MNTRKVVKVAPRIAACVSVSRSAKRNTQSETPNIMGHLRSNRTRLCCLKALRVVRPEGASEWQMRRRKNP